MLFMDDRTRTCIAFSAGRAVNIVFVHQNMPGQFVHLARHFARQKNNKVVFITRRAQNNLRGVTTVEHHPQPVPNAKTHPFAIHFHNQVLFGESVAKVLSSVLKKFEPELVVAHPGWGEAFFIKDVLPTVPLLNYCEFYHRPFGADVHFDPNESVDQNTIFRIRARNAAQLSALESCDWGMSPTKWQWSLHPAAYRNKISVVHDGIDTEAAKPDPEATLQLPNGVMLSRRDEIVTYVARNLEPYRGFPSFMHAVSLIASQRPAAHFVIVGGDDVSYGRRAPDGSTYREQAISKFDVNPAQVHFLGRVSYTTFLKVIQISRAHVYLTVPFVLSWSMLEAMSAGAVVIGSRTPPVMEVIEDGVNGLLVDFFSPQEIADRVLEVLSSYAAFSDLRNHARATIVNNYNLAQCLRTQVELLHRVAGGKQRYP